MRMCACVCLCVYVRVARTNQRPDPFQEMVEVTAPLNIVKQDTHDRVAVRNPKTTDTIPG
jgi:hypothetical protein